MLIRLYPLLFFLLILSYQCLGQNPHELHLDGDMLYKYEKYKEAAQQYNIAGTIDPKYKSFFNTGTALYNAKQYKEAATALEAAQDLAKTDQEKADVAYNLGNAHFKDQAYQKSVDAFKKSLKHRPNDNKTKENLLKARRQLKKQQDQQNQQQQQDQKKDQKDNKDQQDQDNQQDQKNPNQQSSDPNNKKPQQKKMSKEEAERQLKMLENNEKQVQKKLMKRQNASSRGGKEW
jgi:Ca-activated chloride channel homolog